MKTTIKLSYDIGDDQINVSSCVRSEKLHIPHTYDELIQLWNIRHKNLSDWVPIYWCKTDKCIDIHLDKWLNTRN